MAVQKKSRAGVISTFFGKKDGQTTTELLAEIKALSESDRNELAWRAAKALGYDPAVCDFEIPV